MLPWHASLKSLFLSNGIMVSGLGQVGVRQKRSNKRRVAVGKGGAEGAAAGAAAATAEAAMRAAREKAVKACELKGDRDREKT
ncbi:hypothetical protein RUM43_007294 [Polyplax serrata]|uniref:Uncharacterized protein n=1 Tax=Polyplax serrata TaxID=468196 RepID=A0AAN8P1P1_POLSC